MFLQCWFEHVWFSYSVCWLIILHDINFEVGLPVNSAEAVHVSSPLPVVEWPTYPTPTPEAARTEWNWMTGHDVEWLAYDLLYFLMTRAELDRFPEKVMGHAMIWSKTQAWINNFTDKYSDSINFKKLGPLWVKNIPTSWQNVVPPPERESVEILGFRVFVFSQQKHSMRLWSAFFWDVSCSSTYFDFWREIHVY